jgi:hypothetical protein
MGVGLSEEQHYHVVGLRECSTDVYNRGCSEGVAAFVTTDAPSPSLSHVTPVHKLRLTSLSTSTATPVLI